MALNEKILQEELAILKAILRKQKKCRVFRELKL